jgi:type IV pilus assembly protein PilC
MTEPKKTELKESRLSYQDEAAFFSHLALMFDAGVPISKAFEVLARSPDGFSRVILAILTKLESGFGLRGAFDAHRESFSPISLTLVSTGERSGSLGSCLNMAASWAENAANFRSKIIGAVTYPALVLGVNLILTLAFLIWLVPAFHSMIDMESAALLTRAVLTASDLVRNPYFWLTLILVGCPLVWKLLPILKRGNASRFLIYVPILSGLIKTIHRARYWMVFSFLYQAGSPLLLNLELAARASQSERFSRLYDELKESIMRGEPVAEHFDRYRSSYGSMLVAGMTLLSQGQVGPNLCDSLNRHFQVEVETMLDKFHVILEPILISLVSITTGLLLIGLYLPFGRFLQQVLVEAM